jgi:hypothetical protein
LTPAPDNALEQTTNSSRVLHLPDRRQLWNYENAVSAYEEGTYEEDLFASLTAYYRSLLNCPGGILWAERGELPLREQTKRYLQADQADE